MALTYSTSKEVNIHSKRLVVLNWSIKLCIIVYGVLNILVFHRYAAFETPSTIVNLWSNDWDPDLRDLQRSPAVTGPAFCDNPVYDVAPGQATTRFRASNISCRNYSNLEMVSIKANEFSVATFTKIRNFTNLDQNQTTERDYFAVGAEDVVINLMHSFKTSFQSAYLGARTRFRDSRTEGVLREFAQGEQIRNLTIKDMLHFAGVNLTQENYPNNLRLRVSGTVILVRLVYSNLRTADFSTEVLCDAYVSHIPELWGYLGTQVLHNHDGTRVGTISTNAVRVVFIGEGQLGNFDFTNLVLNIVSSVVLLRLSSFVVDRLAKTCNCVSGDKVNFSRLKTQQVAVVHRSNDSPSASPPVNRGYRPLVPINPS